MESWNVKAAAWDEQVGETGDANRRLNSDPVLWNLAGEVQGKRVLDAGCGTGYLSRELTHRGASVVGVDFSPAMVEISRKHAREQGLNIDHFVADGCRLFPSDQAALEEGTFDLAISNYVLMDMPNLQGAIESLARALRPGGVAVLILSHPCFPQGDTTSVDEDPRSSVVTYRWSHNYFEPTAHLEPAWGRFDTAFPSFHRPLSDYFQAFTSAGFTVTDLEEPRLTPDRFHLTEDDERRKRRSQLLPYSIAFRLLRK
ncbi:MAG: class I SAM-dependent methyltransferase [bacterium]|nr:class I SAM-dependent methyltransferase [bacterium]